MNTCIIAQYFHTKQANCTILLKLVSHMVSPKQFRNRKFFLPIQITLQAFGSFSKLDSKMTSLTLLVHGSKKTRLKKKKTPTIERARTYYQNTLIIHGMLQFCYLVQMYPMSDLHLGQAEQYAGKQLPPVVNVFYQHIAIV